MIDLSDVSSITRGTCGTYLIGEYPYRQGFELPNDPGAYPLKIILPASPGTDPSCEAVCNEFEPYTAFGIALETDGLIGAGTGRGLSVLVSPPWKFVSGGCGEACTYPCLGGYQEFGVRSCVTFFHGDFGLATAEPAAPAGEALVELVTVDDSIAPTLCCLYRSGP